MPSNASDVDRGVSKLAGLWRHCGAAAAVEMALVVPVLLMFLLGIIQFGSLLFLHHQMTVTANDVARRVAVGELNETAAIAEASSRLAGWKATFAVDVGAPAADEVGVNISVPMAEVAIVNFVQFLGTGTLVAQAIMRKEV